MRASARRVAAYPWPMRSYPVTATASRRRRGQKLRQLTGSHHRTEAARTSLARRPGGALPGTGELGVGTARAHESRAHRHRSAWQRKHGSGAVDRAGLGNNRIELRAGSPRTKPGSRSRACRPPRMPSATLSRSASVGSVRRPPRGRCFRHEPHGPPRRPLASHRDRGRGDGARGARRRRGIYAPVREQPCKPRL